MAKVVSTNDLLGKKGTLSLISESLIRSFLCSSNSTTSTENFSLTARPQTNLRVWLTKQWSITTQIHHNFASYSLVKLTEIKFIHESDRV